jgi:hypothetical protein
MKKQYIKTFKQIYKDKNTNEEKSFSYKVGIVKDTESYQYRIMNFDSLTIWKHISFKTFKEAEDYLNKHPHNINRETK